MNFQKLNLGTKIVSTILAVVIACLAVMSYVIISRTSTIQTQETYKLLNNTAARLSNLVGGYFNEMYAVLETQQDTINTMLNNGANEERLAEEVETLLDSAGIANYAYLYIIDNAHSGENIHNPDYRASDNHMLILAVDTDTKNLGGVTFLKPDNNIIQLPSVLQALQDGKPNIGAPVIKNIAGQGQSVGVAMNYPLKNRAGRVIAVLGLFVNLNAMSREINIPERSVFKGDYKFIVTNEGRIAAHPDTQMQAKLLNEVNPHQSVQRLVEALKAGKSGIYEYFNARGDESLTAVSTFRIGRESMGVQWNTIVTAPIESITEPVRSLTTIIVICTLIALVIIGLALFFYIRTQVITRINTLYNLLSGFFKYLNHETKTPPAAIKPRAEDEIGSMTIAINNNIQKIQKGLDQDTQAVQESIETANRIEEGDLTARITANPHNPQLNELKKVLNEMLETLQKKLGATQMKLSVSLRATQA